MPETRCNIPIGNFNQFLPFGSENLIRFRDRREFSNERFRYRIGFRVKCSFRRELQRPAAAKDVEFVQLDRYNRLRFDYPGPIRSGLSDPKPTCCLPETGSRWNLVGFGSVREWSSLQAGFRLDHVQFDGVVASGRNDAGRFGFFVRKPSVPEPD